MMEAEMDEQPFDEYADQFLVNFTAYGASISFSRSDPKPAAIGARTEMKDLGTIRTSVEHLKAMAFVMQRVIKEVERTQGVQFPVPIKVLNNLGIAPEDWETFWRQS
jgi:hypothetical protein